jgi:hypothetical protein
MVVIPLEMSAFVTHKWQKWRNLLSRTLLCGKLIEHKYSSTVALAGKVNYHVLFSYLQLLCTLSEQESRNQTLGWQFPVSGILFQTSR